MRYAEGRKKEARKVIQINKVKQHSTPKRQSLFLRKMSYLEWDSLARPSLGVHMSITRLSPSPDRVASEINLGCDSVHVYMKVESEAKKSYVS